MSAEPRFTDQDYELLSAYLDGELTDAERAHLEARLETESDLRREWEALRQTVALVRQLPPLSAPRDFTLTRAMLAPPRKVTPLFLRPHMWSAAAAVLVLIFGGVWMLSGSLDAPHAVLSNMLSESQNTIGEVAVMPSATKMIPTPPPTMLAQQQAQPSAGTLLVPPTMEVTTLDSDGFREEIPTDDEAQTTVQPAIIAPAPMVDGAVTSGEDTSSASRNMLPESTLAAQTFAADAADSALQMAVSPAPTSAEFGEPGSGFAAGAGGGLTNTQPPAANPLPPESAEKTQAFAGALATDSAPAVSQAATIVPETESRGDGLDQPENAPMEKAASPAQMDNTTLILVIMAGAGLVLIASIVVAIRQGRRAS